MAIEESFRLFVFVGFGFREDENYILKEMMIELGSQLTRYSGWNPVVSHVVKHRGMR